MLGLMGEKLGMTQVFTPEGEMLPVTVVRLGPCTVTQVKTVATDGYNAIQVGYKAVKPSRMPKARRGHLEKKGLPLFAHLAEFRTERASEFAVGEELVVSGFKPGDGVQVSGVTKGRGFQGVMKRHNKHGGPASHGSDFHRRPGSIGMRTWPGHVLKNMKLPGHMGDVNVTIKGLDVVAVRPEDDAVLVRGALPGSRGGMVVVTCIDEAFETRPELKRGAKAKGGEPADAESSSGVLESTEAKAETQTADQES